GLELRVLPGRARENQGDERRSLDSNRRQVLPGPRRLLLVRGPFRRHDESGRHLGESHRGRERAYRTPRGAGVRCWFTFGSRRLAEALCVCRSEKRQGWNTRAGGRVATVRPRAARGIQEAAVGGVYLRAAEDRARQDPKSTRLN